MNDKELVDIKALAKRLQVSVNTVRNWIKSGQIPESTYIQVNQTRRFYVADVEAALRADKDSEYRTTPKQPFVLDNNEDDNQ